MKIPGTPTTEPTTETAPPVSPPVDPATQQIHQEQAKTVDDENQKLWDSGTPLPLTQEEEQKLWDSGTPLPVEPSGRPATTSEADLDSLLSSALNESLQMPIDKHVTIRKIVSQTGADANYVEQNFDDIYKQWINSKFDPAEFRRNAPLLAKELLKRPANAPIVVQDDKMKKLENKLHRWWTKYGPVTEAEQLGDVIIETPGGPTLEQQLAERDNPQMAVVNDARAREGQAAGPITRTIMRAEDSALDAKASMVATGIVMRKLRQRVPGLNLLGSTDTWDQEKELMDLESQIVPRDYGGGDVDRVFQMGAQAVGSQIEMLKGGGAGAILGYIAGFTPSLVTTKNLAVAHEAGIVGAGIGMGAGAETISFLTETGSFYRQGRDEKTDSGEPIDEDLLLGASTFYGLIAAKIETMSFDATARMFGPLGTAIKRGVGVKTWMKELGKSRFAQIAKKIGKAYGERSLDEGFEEVLQGASSDLIDYTQRSLVDQKLQKADPMGAFVSYGEQFTSAAVGSAMAGLPTAGASLAFNKVAQHLDRRAASLRSAAQVRAIGDMHDALTTEASPELVETVVKRATELGGEEVAKLYINAEDMKKVFDEADVNVNTLLGPEGNKALTEAMTAGAQLSFTVKDFLTVVKKHELGDKLEPYFKTRPTYIAEANDAEDAKQFDEEVSALTERLIKENTEPESQAERDLIDQLQEGLKGTKGMKPRFTPAQAENMTAVWRATLRTLAKKMGVSPDDLVNFGVDIKRGDLQPEDNAVTQDTRGSTTQVGDLHQMILTPDADISTFLNLSSSTFFKTFGEAANRLDTPVEVKDDWAKIRKHLGATGEQLTPEQTAKLAKEFERYLMEGKSPSLSLDRPFQKYKQWLTKVYKNTADHFNDTPLSDEISGVFDRLLATEQEMQRAEEASGGDLPRTPQEAGVTPEEWPAFLEKKAKSRTKAGRSAELRLMKDMQRKREKEYRAHKKYTKERLAKVYEDLPARRASNFLHGYALDEQGRKIQTNKTITLNRREVEAAVGKDLAKRFTTGAKGLSPDKVAGVFGYGNGAKMLRDILATADKDKWISRQAAEYMNHIFPSMLEDRAKLKDAAEHGLHNDETAQWYLAQIAALRKKVDPAAWDNYSKEFATSPEQEIKRAAREYVNRRVVRDISTHRILTQERSANEQAARAAARGDFGQALVFKVKAMFNFHVWRYMRDAANDRDRMTNMAAQMSSRSAQGRLGKVSPAVRDAVMRVLESTALKKMSFNTSEAGVDRMSSILEDSGVIRALSFTPSILDSMVQHPRHWKKQTVREMYNILGMLKNVKAYENAAASVIRGNQKMEREALKAQLFPEWANSRKDLGPVDTRAGIYDRIANKADALDSWLTSQITLFSWMGGKNYLESATWNTFVVPMREADVKEAEIILDAIEPIRQKLDAVPADTRGRFGDYIDSDRLFPTHKNNIINAPATYFELCMLYLNIGNVEGRQRLLDGRGITYEQAVNAFNENFDEPTVDWLQSVLDTSDNKMWPLVRAHAEAMEGVAPEPVVALPIQTKFGTKRGGYFHIVYDWRTAVVTPQQIAANTGDYMDPTYIPPSTPHGFTKRRVAKFNGIIALDNPANIFTGLAQQAHDIAFRPVITSIANLLNDHEVDAELKRRIGPERLKGLHLWLMDVGRQRGIESALYSGMLNSLNRGLKKSVGRSALGYVPAIAITDVWNLSTAVITTELHSHRLAMGIAECLTNPVAMAKWAQSFGAFKMMHTQMIREFNVEISRLNEGKHWAKDLVYAYRDYAFAFMETTQFLTAVPVLRSAYQQGLKKYGGNEMKARAFAEDVLLRAFPTYTAVNASRILRDKGFWGMTTMFHGWSNLMYNRARDFIEPVLQANGMWGKLKTLPRAAAYLNALFVVIGPLSDLTQGHGFVFDPDSDDNKRVQFAKWFLKSYFVGAFSMVPLGGNMARAFAQEVRYRSQDAVSAAGEALIETAVYLGKEVMAMLDEEKKAPDHEKTVLSVLRSLGMVSGTPYRPFTQQGDALYRNLSGTSENVSRSSLKYGEQLFYGDKETGTPFSLFYDKEIDKEQ